MGEGRGEKEKIGSDKGAKMSILINGEEKTPPKREMTGLEIKQLGGRDGSFLLVQLDESGSGGGDGMAISNEAIVRLKDGMKFRLVSAATFG